MSRPQRDYLCKRCRNMRVFESSAGKLRCRTCKTLMTPDGPDPPEGLRPSRQPDFFAWCPDCMVRSPFFTFLHLFSCAVCSHVFEQRPPEQAPRRSQQRSNSQERPSDDGVANSRGAANSVGNRARRRDIAKRWHPDAHPNASAAEKERLGKRFAEEMAKVDREDRREADAYSPTRWPSPDDKWWEDADDDRDDFEVGTAESRRTHERVKAWEQQQKREEAERRAQSSAWREWYAKQVFPLTHRIGCGAIAAIPIVCAFFDIGFALITLCACMLLNNLRGNVWHKDLKRRYESETGRRAP